MTNPYSSPVVSAVPLRLAGRFVWFQALLVLLAAPILGAIFARGAVSVQAVWAPLLIFPLVVGSCLGLLLAGLIRLGQIGHRATFWSGAILTVAVAVAGQHYFSFLDWKAARIAVRTKGHSLAELMVVDEMRPEEAIDFAAYMQRQATIGRPVTAELSLRGAAAWASWTADGLLTLMAAATIIYLVCRGPYCSKCRTWYRTIRGGQLAADEAKEIAAAASLPLEETAGGFRYRLRQCMGGCGPSRLEMTFDRLGARSLDAWLSAAQRERVTRVLDGEQAKG
jgi:hypothetical protein